MAPEIEFIDPTAFPGLPPDMGDKSSSDRSKRSVSPLSPASGGSPSLISGGSKNYRQATVSRTKPRIEIKPPSKFQPGLGALAEMPGKESEGSTSSLETETDLKSSVPEQIEEQLIETMNKHLDRKPSGSSFIASSSSGGQRTPVSQVRVEYVESPKEATTAAQAAQ